MFQVVAALLLPIMMLLGGGGEKKVDPKWEKVGGIVRLQGRWAGGHACPVSPTLALSNAHMVDFREPSTVLDSETTLPTHPIIYRFESLDGQSSGVVKAEAISISADLSFLSGQFKRFYPIAAICPGEGDRLLNLAYTLDDKKGTLRPRLIESKALVSVAGKIEYDNSGSFGSSGSCVLNEAGEVVAINSQVLMFKNSGSDKVQDLHGQGVLVCGEWKPAELTPQQ